MSREQIEGFALSPQQRRLWLLQTETGVVYRAQCLISLLGAVDVEILRRALLSLIDRHEILRTGYTSLPGMSLPIQIISEHAQLDMPEHELEKGIQLATSETLEALCRSLGERPIDLTSGQTLHAELFRAGADEAYLFISLPSLNADAATLRLLIDELCSAYRALSTDDVEPLEEPLQYSVISEWFNELLEGDEAKIAAENWKHPGLLEALDVRLPSQCLPDETRRPESHSYHFRIEPEAATRIRSLCRSAQTQELTFLLACWHVLISRVTGREISVVGLHTDGRKIEELQHAMGLISKHVPVRCVFGEGDSLRQILRQVEDSVEQSGKEQEYFSWESASSDIGEIANQFWPICFEYHEQAQAQSCGNATFTLLTEDVSFERHHVKLTCVRRGDFIAAELSYDASILDDSFIFGLAEQYLTLLHNGADGLDGEISALLLLSEVHRNRIIYDWNETTVDYQPLPTLHAYVSRQARLSPGATALISDDQQLSYGELEEQSNQLAHYLRSLGVSTEHRVGICLDRSAEMVIALLAALKAGAAYLPLDPSYPRDRLEYLIRDAAVEILITDEQMQEVLGGEVARIVNQGREAAEIAGQRKDEVESGVTADNAAYVIYTSGSTGKPKGVVNSHGAICNRLLWMQDKFPLVPGDRVLQKTTISFDASIWELFEPLMTGACLVLARPEGHRDAQYLLEAIQEHGITILQMVPSMLQVLLEVPGIEKCSSLRRVYCGGEALPTRLKDRLYQQCPQAKLINLYGPTEASIDAAMWECQRNWRPISNVVPVGKPIANTQLYILDRELQPVPIGVAGELHIGGIGLARGYLSKPDLTAERFIPHPFSQASGKRIYKTGDMARYLPDGNIEFLGRIDHQVKVRGYRIELGEIEAVLAQHSEIREAVVLARGEGAAEKRLIAYVVSRGEQPATGELREYLRERLPEYMVPSGFVWVERMPVTANGKLDRAALPEWEEVEGAGRESEYVEPRGAVEEMLAGVWSEVLGVERVGIHDNFFELGGHSLLAMQVISRIRDAFRVELPLRTLFESPTVAEMAARVEPETRSSAAVDEPIRVAERGRALPLSYAQQRLWFLSQLNPDSATYNIPAAVRLSGQLDAAALRGAMDEVVRRHEVLRTTFSSEQGHPVQIIQEPAPLQLTITDLSALSADEQQTEVERQSKEETSQAFDLERGPVVRARLLRLSDDEHVLLFTVHHIASDGWSTGVMIREVAALYEAYSLGEPSPLPELPIQYVDYAVWQRQWLQGEVVEAQLSYWREQLAGAPVLELPTDKVRPALQSFRGARHYINLGEELSRELRELSRAEGVTLYMVLLAGFQILLSRYSGQEDVVVGSPIAGRTRAELEPLIGFFVNTLVLRTDLSGEPTVREVLQRVREVSLGGYGHQDVPFEQLVEELGVERDLSRNPFFQVVFLLNSGLPDDIRLAGLKLEQLHSEAMTAKFDLVMEIIDRGPSLEAVVSYATDLFEDGTISRMLGHFESLLEGMASNPDQGISELPLIREAEQQRLEEWSHGETNSHRDEVYS